MTYKLSGEELRQLISDLKKERPWDLPSQLGDAVADGPSRSIDIILDRRRGRFGLFSLPKGASLSVLRREASVLGSAIRVCERIRSLAKDEGLQPCTE